MDDAILLRKNRTMTNQSILIGLGGTGARIVESVLMLAMAGVGPANLSVMLIDSDGAHGNGERTAQALTRYNRFCQIWSGGAHGMDYSAADAPALGRIAVEPILPQGYWQWSPAAHQSSLSAMAEGVPKALSDALFLANAKEFERQGQYGLGGRAHIAAALFSSLFTEANNSFVRTLRDALSNGASIVMAGSSFGGTGAGAMMALYRALSDAPRRGGSINALAMPPYFDNGEGESELALRSQRASRAFHEAGLSLIPMTAQGLVDLPHYGRSGRGQCNPSMPDELAAAAQILAHWDGAAQEETPLRTMLPRLHHALRVAHFSLYETQLRLREKPGLLGRNWALSLAGKFDPATVGEPINLLADISRRMLEWAGSIEVMAGQQASLLGWRIAPMSVSGQPITDAPRQGVQMVHPNALTPPQIAAAFDRLTDHDSNGADFATVLRTLRRKPQVDAEHRGMARALVAAHHAIGGGLTP